jgi:5-methyltetrahydrofolate--homocysteine methyltransferase
MTRSSLLARVNERVVLLDGGMGTALMEQGLPAGKPGELWNVERPESVRAVHARYIDAGCEVVQTNTFGGNLIRLESHGIADRFEEINQAGARLAREAAGEDRLVAGNLGPSGHMLAPLGDLEPEDLEQAYKAQAEVLASAGVDYISIETLLGLEEALIALRGARAGAPDLLVTVCLVFEKKKRGFFSPMGTTPGEAALHLSEAGADLVGANCSMGSEEMAEMAPEMVSKAGVPVVMKPNAGLPEMEGTRTVYKQPPESFVRDILSMVRSGVKAVGGCCGTDERFMAALREGLDAL